jgi:UDP:flavonoid glycosyltransferase YjiC (YdhE family)
VSDRLRIVVAAIGWTGHAFPAFALGRELGRRGHAVTFETLERWRAVAEELGARFVAAPERIRFAGGEPGPGPTLAEAARELEPLLDDVSPQVVVSDLFALAPALAAEAAGVRRATLIPHPYPVREPGLPLYPLGLLPPRTPVGKLAWRAAWPVVGTRLPNTRLRRVRAELDRSRAELGLAPLARYDGQISEQLALVATFPQLEYPRRWPRHARVTGPMPFELPYPEVELPPGPGPLVLVASSTERDPEHGLIGVALEALADEPVRVIATTNRRGDRFSAPIPANARVVDWLSYSRVLPAAALAVCHGGHGTVTRALGAGVPVLVSPPAGDMAENGARVAWCGAGLMLPGRLLSAGSLRIAARRLLSERRFAARAAAIAAWQRSNDGAAAGADLVEGLARGASG